MPDILIRGINKPESCGRCPFRDFGDDVFYDCVINKKLGTECTINSVKYYYSNCPLVELPAHGDLISRDEAVSVLQSIGSRNYRREKGTICDAIKMISHSQYVPAIIPASEEDG